MAPDRIERRLAAIVSADVVGWSRLMGEDEAGTLATLKAHREELIDPEIKAYGGRIVGTAGDSLLIEYPSAVDAVGCSLEIQRAMAERNVALSVNRQMEFRVGINVGEVIVDDDDIFGDGVNIAARVQGLCEPGGVYVSGKVHDEVRGKLDASFEDLGEKSVKNIVQPLRVYAVREVKEERATIVNEGEALPLPSKPSIAVLPFDNMSGDPEQEYFSDGIAEDIITGLASFRDLFVIARNSSFTYKGSAVDIKQVGRELGVRYVLEGGVRKAGERVRITAQLIEAASGNHLWAEKFDGDLGDIFDLQDQITASVVGAIRSSVTTAEMERAGRKRPENLDAYEWCMRGWSHEAQFDKTNFLEAKKCFLKSIELDERLVQAYTGLAHTCFWQAGFGWSESFEKSIGEAERAARKAIATEPNDAEAHTWLCACLLITGRLDAAVVEIERAVELSPNYAQARAMRGAVYCYSGRPREGVDEAKLALRLSPRDPFRIIFLHELVQCQNTNRDYADAAETATKMVNLRPEYLYGHFHLAVSCGHLEQTARARTAVNEMMRLNPNIDREFVKSVTPYKDPANQEHIIGGLQKAGWEG